jgi:hypothetical protein
MPLICDNCGKSIGAIPRGWCCHCGNHNPARFHHGTTDADKRKQTRERAYPKGGKKR